METYKIAKQFAEANRLPRAYKYDFFLREFDDMVEVVGLVEEGITSHLKLPALIAAKPLKKTIGALHANPVGLRSAKHRVAEPLNTTKQSCFLKIRPSALYKAFEARWAGRLQPLLSWLKSLKIMLTIPMRALN